MRLKDFVGLFQFKDKDDYINVYDYDLDENGGKDIMLPPYYWGKFKFSNLETAKLRLCKVIFFTLDEKQKHLNVFIRSTPIE